jgi:hypothetical protein
MSRHTHRYLLLSLLLTPLAIAQHCPLLPVGANDAKLLATPDFKVLIDDDDVRVIDMMVPAQTIDTMATSARPTVFIVDHNPPSGAQKIADPSLWPTEFWYVKPESSRPFHNPSGMPIHAIRMELKHPGCGPTVVPVDPKNDGAIVTEPDHRVVYDDGDIRVMDVTLQAHSTQAMHTHYRPSIMYTLDVGTMYHLTPANPVGSGPKKEHVMIAHPIPTRLWVEELHAGDNYGDFMFHAYRTEIKRPLVTRKMVEASAAPAPAK